MPSVLFILVFCMVCTSCCFGVHASNNINVCQAKCPFNLIPCQRYMADSQGCPTCQCLCYSFRLICPGHCSFGTEYVIDNHGCSYCRCACSKSCLQPCRRGNLLEPSRCT